MALAGPDVVIQAGRPRRMAPLWFATEGVLVAAGAPVRPRVPEGERRRYARAYAGLEVPVTGWAKGRRLAEVGQTALRPDPCPVDAAGRWTLFTGGFLTRGPACVSLVVSSAGRSETVRLRLRRRCA